MSALAGLLPILNRIDALIAKIDELLIALGVVIPPDGIIILPPQLVVERLNNRYLIATVDTSDATERAIDLKDTLLKQGVEYARYMVVLAVGGDFTYKLNDKGAAALDAQIGAEHIFEIEEIYVTGSGSAGTGKIFLEYRVE